MIEEGLTRKKTAKPPLDLEKIMAAKKIPRKWYSGLKLNIKNRLIEEGVDLDLGKYYNGGLAFIKHKKSEKMADLIGKATNFRLSSVSHEASIMEYEEHYLRELNYYEHR
jgi:hypothetical protein